MPAMASARPMRPSRERTSDRIWTRFGPGPGRPGPPTKNHVHPGRKTAMRHLLKMPVACAALSVVTWQSVAQQTNQFPLAAPAGVDSRALQAAPPGAVNQGPYDMNSWKYGNAPAFTAPAGAKIWNP